MRAPRAAMADAIAGRGRGGAPDRLIHGRSIKVHVSANVQRGDPAQSLRAYARFAPYRSAADGRSLAFVKPDAASRPPHSPSTPPAQPGPTAPRSACESCSLLDPRRHRRGRRRPQGAELPLRYQVLETRCGWLRTKGSQAGGICASLGGTSGTITLAGDSDGVTQDIEDTPPSTERARGPSMGGPLP